ncbi:MAG: OmpH family outer membrane protein [Crocinitomicaceae bacterium]
MKKILFVVAIAFVALASCGEKKKEEAKSTVPEKLMERSAGSLKIAFYNQDSLKELFRFYKDQDELVQKKQLSFQREVDRMTKEYQEFLALYDKQAQQGLLSQNQIQGIQQKAAEKEQKIVQYQQNEGAKIEKETMDRLEVIGKKIEAYSKQFSEENKIDILLTHAAGGQIAFISPTMDVTKEFIEYLNQHEEEIDKNLK